MMYYDDDCHEDHDPRYDRADYLYDLAMDRKLDREDRVRVPATLAWEWLSRGITGPEMVARAAMFTLQQHLDLQDISQAYADGNLGDLSDDPSAEALSLGHWIRRCADVVHQGKRKPRRTTTNTGAKG